MTARGLWVTYVTLPRALVALALGGCATGNVPLPEVAQVRAEDYVEVPFAPRPPPVEIVPKRPVHEGSLVWVDGGWAWNVDRYRWDPGAWIVLPAGAKRIRWAIVRRTIDGQLFFAPSGFCDAEGRPLAPPSALARASTRPGGPAGAGDLTAPGGVRTDLEE